MNYKNIPQENKAEILENAVINGPLEELVKTYKELGYIEMTARALGTACRFCGLETVKTLVDCGATFGIPIVEGVESRYHCYAGMKWSNYRTNYALYLLNITKQIKGACCCKGLKLLKQVKKDDKTALKFLPDRERAEVLKYLCENAEKLSFAPKEMLYYAIFTRDDFIVSELKKLGVKLSEKRVNIITNGGPISDGYWYEWVSMTGKLSDRDYLPVMEKIAAELDGKQFHCTGKVYDITKTRFDNTEILEFFRDNFKTEKLSKTGIIRDLIDLNNPGAFPVIEKLGWLSDPRRRDEMTDYAQKLGNRIECVAWLLDFKNRTADLAAERAKAEKKAERELNASPTSVAMMKKTWGFKKQEDGTLIITSYKGTSTEVTVPGTIGKSTVTAIGAGAFAGGSGLCGGRVITYASYEQQKDRRTITKIIMPESVTFIGNGAFADMTVLTDINIPESVTEIGDAAFYQCPALTSIVIPKTMEWIGEFAFRKCDRLTAVVERGSYAEGYCKKNGVKFKYKEQ